MELLQPLPHPSVEDLRLVRLPLTANGERASHRTPPPALGADSAAVLRDAGYTDEAIQELQSAGVIRTG
jgi:crotonobetainyl-CoA:carnitine CoA-transferase CaiB-like acyl-CoA transferase